MNVLALSTDSADLLQQAVFLVEDLEQRYPVSAASLAEIDTALRAIALLTKVAADDYDAVTVATVQVIHSVVQLPFATEELRAVLCRYLRIMEAGRTVAAQFSRNRRVATSETDRHFSATHTKAQKKINGKTFF